MISEETSLLMKEEVGLTRMQAVLSIVNINVGLAILGLPYAFKMTGFWKSVCLLTIATAWSALTAYYLMHCFAHPKVQAAKVDGYAQLGRFLLKNTGFLISSVAEIGWCFLASCAVFLNVAKNAMTFLPFSRFAVYIFCIVLALPTVMVKNMTDLKSLAILGSITPLLLVGCLLFISLFATKAETPESSGDLALGAGIFILSYTSSPAYPGIFKSLENKKDFPNVIIQSFAIMVGINIIMGAVGVYIYGSETSIIIAQNLKQWPGSFAFFGITSLLWISLFCMIAPLNLLVGDAFKSVLQFQNVSDSMLRIITFSLTVILSFPLQSLIAKLEAFVGNCFGIIITFILPTIFHYILYRKSLSLWNKVVHWISIIVGIICCVVFTAQLFI